MITSKNDLFILGVQVANFYLSPNFYGALSAFRLSENVPYLLRVAETSASLRLMNLVNLGFSFAVNSIYLTISLSVFFGY